MHSSSWYQLGFEAGGFLLFYLYSLYLTLSLLDRINVAKIKPPGFLWIFVLCTEYFYEKSKPSHHWNTQKSS